MDERPQHSVACAQLARPCFRCHVRSIQVSASAMPTRRTVTNAGLAEEKKILKDLPAYKRLRMEGMQPKSTADAARIEATANSRYEVETGHHFDNPKDAARADSLNREVQHAMATGEKIDL